MRRHISSNTHNLSSVTHLNTSSASRFLGIKRPGEAGSRGLRPTWCPSCCAGGAAEGTRRQPLGARRAQVGAARRGGDAG